MLGLLLIKSPKMSFKTTKPEAQHSTASGISPCNSDLSYKLSQGNSRLPFFALMFLR